MTRKNYSAEKLRRWAENEKDVIVSAGAISVSEAADTVRLQTEEDGRKAAKNRNRKSVTAAK